MSAKNLFEQLLQLVQPTKLGFVACLAQRSGCKAISILPWKIGIAILLSAFCWMLKAGPAICRNRKVCAIVCGTYLFGPSNRKSNLVSGQVACLVYSEMLCSVPVTSCDILGMA